MSLVGFKAKNHNQQVAARGADDGVDERITPAEIFDPLNARYGFTLDVAANAKNAKCERYFDIETDGLQQCWAEEVVWCNPPYSACAAWVAKAAYEVRECWCPTAVLLLPSNRTEQKWWQTHIEPYRDKPGSDRNMRVTVEFLAGRRRFGWPEGRVVPPKGDRPPFGLAVVVFSSTASDDRTKDGR
jgi:phage N-6-adenine-methyltransferase